jgi:hypothetical protein
MPTSIFTDEQRAELLSFLDEFKAAQGTQGKAERKAIVQRAVDKLATDVELGDSDALTKLKQVCHILMITSMCADGLQCYSVSTIG